LQNEIDRQRKLFDNKFEDKKKKITSGDDLAPGVLKTTMPRSEHASTGTLL